MCLESPLVIVHDENVGKKWHFDGENSTEISTGWLPSIFWTISLQYAFNKILVFVAINILA